MLLSIPIQEPAHAKLVSTTLCPIQMEISPASHAWLSSAQLAHPKTLLSVQPVSKVPL